MAVRAMLWSAGLLALVGAGAFVAARLLPPPEPLSQAERDEANRRLVLENHNFDEAARGVVLKQALEAAGHRCDSVSMAHMSSPGRWSVECRPGHRYRCAFDGDGKVISTVRVR